MFISVTYFEVKILLKALFDAVSALEPCGAVCACYEA